MNDKKDRENGRNFGADGRGLMRFSCAEEDSLYAIRRLREKEERGLLSEGERRQLFYMEKRETEGEIDLTPAVIYAAANHGDCCAWLHRAPQRRQEEWYGAGVAWLRQNPAFLEKFGWKERKSAVLAAGLLALAMDGNEGRRELEEFLRAGWSLMWERMGQIRQLDAAEWEEMMAPWQDSCHMSCGVAAVLLLMAALNDRPVRDRDRLWRSLQKLRQFSRECFQPGTSCPPCREEFPFEKEDRMGWLLSRFANPQRPAYIREKARLSSEWLERLYRVMALAGLPASACETMNLSCREVQQILELMEEKPTERQYMTFLMLYAVSRELAQAGRAAAALDAPGSRGLPA